MKLKNKKVLLGTMGSALIVATPLAVVISCNKPESEVVPSRNISINMDKAIKYAQENATVWNNNPEHYAKNSAGDKFVKYNEDNGGHKSQYRDPMAWITKNILEQLFDSIGKDAPSFATISQKLKKGLNGSKKTGFTYLGEKLKNILFNSKVITSNKVVARMQGAITMGWDIPTDPTTSNPVKTEAKYSITDIADKLGTTLNDFYGFWDKLPAARKASQGGEEGFNKMLVGSLISSTVPNLIFPIKPKSVISDISSEIIKGLGEVLQLTDISNGEFVNATNELISKQNEITITIGGQNKKLTINKTKLPQDIIQIIEKLDRKDNAGNLITVISPFVANMISGMFHNFALEDLISGDKSLMHTAGDDKGHKEGNGHTYSFYDAAINTVPDLKEKLKKNKADIKTKEVAKTAAKTTLDAATISVNTAKSASTAAPNDAALKTALINAEKALKLAKDKFIIADDALYNAKSLEFKINIQIFTLVEKDLLQQDRIDLDKAKKALDASQKIKDLKAAQVALEQNTTDPALRKKVDDLKKDPEVVRLKKAYKDADGKLYDDTNQLTNEKSAFGTFKLKRTLSKTLKTITKSLNGISIIGNNKVLKQPLKFTEEDKNSLSAFGIDPKIGNMVFGLVENITNLYK